MNLCCHCLCLCLCLCVCVFVMLSISKPFILVLSPEKKSRKLTESTLISPTAELLAKEIVNTYLFWQAKKINRFSRENVRSFNKSLETLRKLSEELQFFFDKLEELCTTICSFPNTSSKEKQKLSRIIYSNSWKNICKSIFPSRVFDHYFSSDPFIIIQYLQDFKHCLSQIIGNRDSLSNKTSLFHRSSHWNDKKYYFEWWSAAMYSIPKQTVKKYPNRRNHFCCGLFC